MTPSTQTPLADEALSALTTLMAAEHGRVPLDQVTRYRMLADLVRTVHALRQAELFRDEAVRFACADEQAHQRRAGLRLVTGNVTTLPRHVTTRPAAPTGGNAA